MLHYMDFIFDSLKKISVNFDDVDKIIIICQESQFDNYRRLFVDSDINSDSNRHFLFNTFGGYLCLVFVNVLLEFLS